MIANVLYADVGTMSDTEIDSLDIDETFHWIIDPETGILNDFQGIPTLDDVKRAYEILGAKVI